MPGKPCRNKGMRGEYKARDELRALGWVADRVPSSGAAQGFKGDVKISKNGVTLKVEVKNEKDSYKTLYALLDNSGGKLAWYKDIEGVRYYVTAGYHMHNLKYGFEPDPDSTEPLYPIRLTEAPQVLGVKKLFSCYKLVKEADFLMVRINHKPFIYIRFWK